MVSFTLRQTTSLVDQANDAPLYRVINQIVGAIGASPAVFVYKVATSAFEHYANAADMERWPDSREEALVRGLGFYRLDNVSRTWASLEDMYEDLDTTLRRVRSLANELSAQRGVVETVRETLIEVA